jgi:hypothetical protein
METIEKKKKQNTKKDAKKRSKFNFSLFISKIFLKIYDKLRFLFCNSLEFIQNILRTFFSNLLRKILSSTIILAIGLAIILNLISCPCRFTIETTSLGINLQQELRRIPNPIVVTTHPYIENLTISAGEIYLSASEFLILNSNETELLGIDTPKELTARSDKHTYYTVQNNENITIPTAIFIEQKSGICNYDTNLRFQIKEKKKDNRPTLIPRSCMK